MVPNGGFADGGFAAWAVGTDIVRTVGTDGNLPLRKNHCETHKCMGGLAPRHRSTYFQVTLGMLTARNLSFVAPSDA